MKKLMILMLVTAFMFSCKKDEEVTPETDAVAISMSEKLISAVNANQVPGDDVMKYFAEGKPLVTTNLTKIKVNGKEIKLQRNKKFNNEVTKAEAVSVENTTAKRPVIICTYEPLIVETDDFIGFAWISSHSTCSAMPKFIFYK